MSQHYAEHITSNACLELYHKWETVRFNGKTHYVECKRCGSRKAYQEVGGHQPIDLSWIDTGEWFDVSKINLPNIGAQ